MRVLVVEDEPEVARSLSRGLAEFGMSVDVALSGEEAVDVLHEGSVRRRRARRHARRRHRRHGLCRLMRLQGAPTAILVLTARDDVKDRLAGFDAGAR